MKKLVTAAVLLALLSPLSAGAVDGIQLYNQKQYAKAAVALGQQISACKNASQLPTLYYYLGCAYYGTGKLPEADKTFRYIRNTYPTTNEAHLAGSMLTNIATAMLQQAGAVGKTPEAESTAHSFFSSSSSKTTASTSAQSSSPAIPRQDDATSDAPKRTAGGPSDWRSPTVSAEELAALPDTGKFNFKRTDSGHMAVTIFLNGKPVDCWFDTGARAFFSKEQLQQAGLDISKATPHGYTRGWAGAPVQLWSMPCQVRLGNVTRTLNIDMQEGSMGNVGALIGQDFVQGYQYEIDDKAGIVSMRKSDATAQKVDNLYDVPCEFVRGDDVIPLQVNGRTCQAFIDTGASNTIIHPSTAKALGIEITDDMERGSIGGVGGSTGVVVAYATLRIGPITRRDFKILIGGTAGNCIGQDFMSGWRFKVDREKHLMRFFH